MPTSLLTEEPDPAMSFKVGWPKSKLPRPWIKKADLSSSATTPREPCRPRAQAFSYSCFLFSFSSCSISSYMLFLSSFLDLNANLLIYFHLLAHFFQFVGASFWFLINYISYPTHCSDLI
jgi:hypothetical protein